MDIKIGDRLLINNIHHARAFVESIEELKQEARKQINVRWEFLDGTPCGLSKVYDTDYQKTWIQYFECN